MRIRKYICLVHLDFQQIVQSLVTPKRSETTTTDEYMRDAHLSRECEEILGGIGLGVSCLLT
jgi:hypothetical protein